MIELPYSISLPLTRLDATALSHRIGLHFIRLIASTSPAERLKELDEIIGRRVAFRRVNLFQKRNASANSFALNRYDSVDEIGQLLNDLKASPNDFRVANSASLFYIATARCQ